MRLEQENDDLAHELVTSKIALRQDLDNVSLTRRPSAAEASLSAFYFHGFFFNVLFFQMLALHAIYLQQTLPSYQTVLGF